MSFRFHVNDEVIVISGRDKGKKGIISKVFVKLNKVIVNKINLVHKHQKPNKNVSGSGGILLKESLIDISNISHFCKCPSLILSKVGFRYENNKKIRYLKKNNLMV